MCSLRIDFRKYREAQECRKKEAQQIENLAKTDKAKSGLTVLQVILLVIVVATGTYYFTGYRQHEVQVQRRLEPGTVVTIEPASVQQIVVQVESPAQQTTPQAARQG